MSMSVVDYSHEFPHALAAQGQGFNFLLLEEQDEPRRRRDGRKALYELKHCWLGKPCENEFDQSFTNVHGTERRLFRTDEINPLLREAKSGAVNLFDHLNLL